MVKNTFKLNNNILLLSVILIISIFIFAPKLISLTGRFSTGIDEPGLVSYYKFEDNLMDEKGENDGTPYGPYCDSPGKEGYACKYNGYTDYIVLQDNPSLSIAGDIAISAWIKFTGTGVDSRQLIISKGQYILGTSPYYLEYDYNTKKFSFLWNTAQVMPAQYTSCTSNVTNMGGEWHHITVTRDTYLSLYNYINMSLVKFYVDGAQAGSCINLANPDPKTSSISYYWCAQGWIGGQKCYDARTSSGSHYNYNNILKYGFNGKIDELRIYNKALSESEVRVIYGSSQLSQECTSDTSCTNLSRPICDTAVKTCVQCVQSSQCAPNEICENNVCNVQMCTIGERINSTFCDADYVLKPFKQIGDVCSQNYECIKNLCYNRCLECFSNSDCADTDKECVNGICSYRSCTVIGERIEGQYCNTTKSFQPFIGVGHDCNQNYECTDNICDNDECESYDNLLDDYCDLMDELNEEDDELC